MHFPAVETQGEFPGWKPSGLPFPGLAQALPQSCFLFSDHTQDSWRLCRSLRSHLLSQCYLHRSRWGHLPSGWNQSHLLAVALGYHTPGDWSDIEPSSHTRLGEWWLVGDHCGWELASSNYDQNYTTAWISMHFPALSGFLQQNPGHPLVRLESCRC